MLMLSVRKTFSEVAKELSDGLKTGSVILAHANAHSEENKMCTEQKRLQSSDKKSKASYRFSDFEKITALETACHHWNNFQGEHWKVLSRIHSDSYGFWYSEVDKILGTALPKNPSFFERVATFLLISQQRSFFDITIAGRAPSNLERAIWIPRLSWYVGTTMLIHHNVYWQSEKFTTGATLSPHLQVKLLTYLRGLHVATAHQKGISKDQMAERIVALSLIMETSYHMMNHAKFAHGSTTELEKKAELAPSFRVDMRFIESIKLSQGPDL